MFKEIRISFLNEETNLWSVDAYKTGDSWEEGRVLAEINDETKEIFWRDTTTEEERQDKDVITAISEFFKI